MLLDSSLVIIYFWMNEFIFFGFWIIDGVKSRTKKEKSKTNNILMLHCGIIFKFKRKKKKKMNTLRRLNLAKLIVKLFQLV